MKIKAERIISLGVTNKPINEFLNPRFTAYRHVCEGKHQQNAHDGKGNRECFYQSWADALSQL
jgi:hypothetical protein